MTRTNTVDKGDLKKKKDGIFNGPRRKKKGMHLQADTKKEGYRIKSWGERGPAAEDGTLERGTKTRDPLLRAEGKHQGFPRDGKGFAAADPE